MTVLGAKKFNKNQKAEIEYWIEEAVESTFFPGRSAHIFLRYTDSDGIRKVSKIGSFGVLHPTVLENFELINPTTAIEINLEPFV